MYQPNPVNDFYFRNAQMQQNYGQQYLPFPPQPQHVPQTPQVNCRFVTNIEEARASMIDPLSYNIFMDSSNGKIYLKKMGNNGQSDFLSYIIEENKTKDPINEINVRLSNIELFLGSIKNDKSVSTNEQSSTVSQSAVTEQNEPNDETKSQSVPKNAGNDFWKKRG